MNFYLKKKKYKNYIKKNYIKLMGCCTSQFTDSELENAETLQEVISVMKKRSEDLEKEKDEINEHLKDPSKEVTFVRIDDLTQEDLERRVPYLEKLHEAYEDVIKTMENVDLPVEETKQHLINIMSNHLISYDLSEKYRNDVAKFKQFAFENEKRLTEGFTKPLHNDS
jgi:prefoldin subunit 5